MKKFYDKKLKEIKLWAWAATVLPIVALSGMFFIEFIGLDDTKRIILTIGATLIFATSVVWWWWALYTISKITHFLGESTEKFVEVKEEIKAIKAELQKTNNS